MKIVYIEDENGEVFSEDKKRRFTRLVGTEAYEYLKSAEGKNKVFFKTDTEEESGDLVLVEYIFAGYESLLDIFPDTAA